MDGRLVAPRIPSMIYGQFNAPPFPAGYLPYAGGDASAFYSPLGVGENPDVWRAGLTQAAAAACYDPAFAAAAHYGYPYGPMMGDGARRKNATRETTSTLKAWLNEHRKNPYPTKGEKIMLAIITKMTLTQVSTWFANARRRLKKENKMTWSPRNRCGEDDDDDDVDDDTNLNDSHRNNTNERNSSRSSSPGRATKSPTENSSRLSSFDLPHQPSLHPFLTGPAITGSFTIQRPTAGAPPSAFHKQEDNSMRRSVPEDEEEVDLESVEEDRKESAFDMKRSISSDVQTERRFNRRGQSPSESKSPRSVFQASTISSSEARTMPPQTHSLQSSAFGPSRTSRRDSISPRSHPYSRNAVVSPSSTIASLSSASSPSKPKIWSLADVATGSDSKHMKSDDMTTANAAISKSSQHPAISAMFGVGPRPIHGLPNPHHQPPMNPEATLRNWMDGMMQQKMAAVAAAMSGGHQGAPPSFFPTSLLPQHLAMNPAAIALAASLPRGHDAARFPHPFPGIAEIAAAQRAQLAATQHAAELHIPNGNITHPMCSGIPNSHRQDNDSSSSRHRIVSTEEKRRSPASTASSPRSEIAEISAFTALNNRPRSGDSGIASAEASKECLSQSTDSATTK